MALKKIEVSHCVQNPNYPGYNKEYQIWGNEGYGWNEYYAADSKEEAKNVLSDYRKNVPRGTFKLVVKRISTRKKNPGYTKIEAEAIRVIKNRKQPGDTLTRDQAYRVLGHFVAKEYNRQYGHLGYKARVKNPYGDKRDYPKIDIFVKGQYVASTTWAKTLKEAKQKFFNTHNDIHIDSIKTKFAIPKYARK